MHRVPTLVVAMAAAGGLAMTAGSVPAVAGGYHVIDSGHVDVFDVAYEDGELELAIHAEETDEEYDPATTKLVVKSEAKTTVPDDPAFDFLGEPGDDVWILPDTFDPDVLFAGWATEEVPTGAFVDDELMLTVHGATGRGKVALYTVDDFGQPEVLFDSDTPPGGWNVPAGSHGHLNWAFTEPGSYTLTVEVDGTTTDTSELVDSGEVTYRFGVRR